MRFFSPSILAFCATAYTAAAFVAKPIVVLPKTGTSQGQSSSSRSVLFMAENNNDESIGFASALASEYEPLGLPARSGRPLKIAIAGGGVGGLTAALCMLKKGFDVTVYEKTAAFARFGGPIQFASNALSVLKEIDDTLFDRVMDKFTFTGTRTCGIKDGRLIV
jgi:zeaxanthin epoxidase